MNIVQLQDQLKNFSQDQLVREMQMPSGSAPQFLVLGEIMRRQKMQQDFTAQQAKGDQGTVAQEAIAAAGVPQGGIADMARAMAPSTDMTQNTGVQAMYAGGPVKKMKVGGKAETDPAVIAMANRAGMSVSQYLDALGEEEAARIEAGAAQRAARNRMMSMEPVAGRQPSYLDLPTQADLDANYRASLTEEPRFRQRPYEQFPEAGGLASPPQPLYPPMPEQPFTNIRPESDRTPPTERPGALSSVVPYTAEDFTTSWSDITGPISDALGEPGATQLSINPATGEFETNLTPGAQIRNIASATGGALGAAYEGIAGLPTFDMSRGDPYSELTADEMKALSSGELSPEAAAAIQQSRMGSASASTSRQDRDQQGSGIAAEATKVEKAAEEKAAADAAAQPTSQGGGAGGAGGMSSFEQELMDALGRREKAAEQDKWLALAQVGLNLMSSTQPTLGGALGEAGLKGVEAARGARDQYDKEKLEILGALEQSRLARAKAASAGAAKPKALPAGALDVYDAEITAIEDALSGLSGPVSPEQQMQLTAQRNALLSQKAALRNIFLSQYGIGSAGASPAAASGVYSMDDVSE